MPPLSTQNTPELTTEEVQAILVQPLEFASVLLASGPRIFDTPGRPVRVPKLTAGVDPDWIGEDEQITEKDADFGEVTLLPDTMKSAKVITRFSNELARSSVVALDAALRARLVTDVAAKLDLRVLRRGRWRACRHGAARHPRVRRHAGATGCRRDQPRRPARRRRARSRRRSRPGEAHVVRAAGDVHGSAQAQGRSAALPAHARPDTSGRADAARPSGADHRPPSGRRDAGPRRDVAGARRRVDDRGRA